MLFLRVYLRTARKVHRHFYSKSKHRWFSYQIYGSCCAKMYCKIKLFPLVTHIFVLFIYHSRLVSCCFLVSKVNLAHTNAHHRDINVSIHSYNPNAENKCVFVATRLITCLLTMGPGLICMSMSSTEYTFCRFRMDRCSVRSQPSSRHNQHFISSRKSIFEINFRCRHITHAPKCAHCKADMREYVYSVYVIFRQTTRNSSKTEQTENKCYLVSGAFSLRSLRSRLRHAWQPCKTIGLLASVGKICPHRCCITCLMPIATTRRLNEICISAHIYISRNIPLYTFFTSGPVRRCLRQMVRFRHRWRCAF